jgi:hypothetical protein
LFALRWIKSVCGGEKAERQRTSTLRDHAALVEMTDAFQFACDLAQ